MSHVESNPKVGEWHMSLTLRGPDGEVKEQVDRYNTVTALGKELIADQLLTGLSTTSGPTYAKPSHMAIGTGTPSATALGTELDRNAFTSKSRLTNVLTMVADWAAGDGTGAITEAGTFNAASGPTMMTSASFAVVNKLAADTLNITWTLTIA